MKSPTRNSLRPYGQMGALAALLATGRRITLEQRIHAIYTALGKEEPEGNTANAVASAMRRLRSSVRRHGITIPHAIHGPASDGGVQLSKADAQMLRELLKIQVSHYQKQATETAKALREAADILDQRDN